MRDRIYLRSFQALVGMLWCCMCEWAMVLARTRTFSFLELFQPWLACCIWQGKWEHSHVSNCTWCDDHTLHEHCRRHYHHQRTKTMKKWMRAARKRKNQSKAARMTHEYWWFTDHHHRRDHRDDEEMNEGNKYDTQGNDDAPVINDDAQVITIKSESSTLP